MDRYEPAPDIDINAAIRNLESNLPEETPQDQQFREELYGKAPKLLARFYVSAEKSQPDADGAPVYREKLCILVQVPGDRDSISQEVTEEHLQQFPREWEHFKSLNARPVPIPLLSLPKMRPNIIKAFEELGIKSVQDLNAKEVPGYLNKWKLWARYLVALHDQADSPKPRLRVA